jgi:single-stranded-DNA-specific exonuclease
MEEGVNRILQAIERDENIIVYGDYDVDGITSTALMIHFFKKINHPVRYLVPNREKDGYGLRIDGVDQVAAMGSNLIITVDNGITSGDAIHYAKEKRIDVVVTDHHLQEGDLPDAAAVINPNRTDSEYPFKTICGVTVAFKLAYALAKKLMPEDEYKTFLMNQLDLVAIGTIADVMPLRNENYALVKYGLKVLSSTRKPGLIELKRISGVKGKTITPISVGYFLAPRLNAAGRMEEASISIELLTTDSQEQASQIAAELDMLNRKRQNLQSDYLENALNNLSLNDTPPDKVIFVENEDWQAGLIGLVSGKLKELYARPTFVFTRDEQGNYVGSARSIEAFHVTNALTKFSQYFLSYGGHHKAAGLTVRAEEFSQFKTEFIQYANETLTEEELVSEIQVDSLIDSEQINLNTARLIQEIGPFGETNPEPLFIIEDVFIRDLMTLSNGRHLKLFLQKDNHIFESIWWGAGGEKKDLVLGMQLDIIFRLTLNNWQGTERLQLVLEDAREHRE